LPTARFVVRGRLDQEIDVIVESLVDALAELVVASAPQPHWEFTREIPQLNAKHSTPIATLNLTRFQTIVSSVK